jgi:hypothetical protein
MQALAPHFIVISLTRISWTKPLRGSVPHTFCITAHIQAVFNPFSPLTIA